MIRTSNIKLYQQNVSNKEPQKSNPLTNLTWKQLLQIKKKKKVKFIFKKIKIKHKRRREEPNAPRSTPIRTWKKWIQDFPAGDETPGEKLECGTGKIFNNTYIHKHGRQMIGWLFGFLSLPCFVVIIVINLMNED